MADFVECTSVNINFNVMGIATVTFTIVTDEPSATLIEDVSPQEFGNKTFTGYVTNVSVNQIPKTSWYEIHITLIATAK